ncbi:MAG: hypothetical protein DMD81_17530, partial [Candidatus Rokuibacteriota bacterium]
VDWRAATRASRSTAPVDVAGTVRGMEDAAGIAAPDAVGRAPADTARVGVAAGFGTGAPSPSMSAVRIGAFESSAARSITFPSSRTFPGQPYACSAASASGANVLAGKP